MLINYPVGLAEPSADTGEEMSTNDSSHHNLPSYSLQNACMRLLSRQPALPGCPLQPVAIDAAKNATTINHTFPKCDIPSIEKTKYRTSEPGKSIAPQKIDELLDSCSEEDSGLTPGRYERLTKKTPDWTHSVSSSSTDEERHAKTNLCMRRTPEYSKKLLTNMFTPGMRMGESDKGFLAQENKQPCDSSGEITFENHYFSNIRNTYTSGLFTHGVRAPNVISNTDTLHNHDDENTSPSADDSSLICPLVKFPTSLKQCSKDDHQSVVDDDKSFYAKPNHSVTLNVSGIDKRMLQNKEQCLSFNAHDIARDSDIAVQKPYELDFNTSSSFPCSTSSNFSQLRRLSPNSSDQELRIDKKLAGMMENDQKDEKDVTRVDMLLDNFDSQNSLTGNCSYFPSPLTDVIPASQERQKCSIEKVEGQNIDFPTGYNDISYPISRKLEDNEWQLHPRHQPVANTYEAEDRKITPSACNVDEKRMELPNKPKHQPYTYTSSDMSGVWHRNHTSAKSRNAFLQQNMPCSSPSTNFQHNTKEAATVEKHHVPSTVRSFRDFEKAAPSINGFILSLPSESGRNLPKCDNRIADESVNIPHDNASHSRNLSPKQKCPSPQSLNTTDNVNHAPQGLKTGSSPSTSCLKSQANFSFSDKGTAPSSHWPSPSKDSEPVLGAQNTSLSPNVQQRLDNFRISNVSEEKITESIALSTSGNLIKSPGRRNRNLAPSFSFSSVNYGQGYKCETPLNYPRHSEASAIGNATKNGSSRQSMFDNSDFDFGFENDYHTSGSSESENASVPTKSLLDANCPSDDIETIKLKASCCVKESYIDEILSCMYMYVYTLRMYSMHL